MSKKQKFKLVVLIIVFITGLFQSTFAFSSQWSISLQNGATQILTVDSISSKGFYVQLPTKTDVKKATIPHNAVKEATPTQSHLVKLTLNTQDSNTLHFLSLEDSILNLAGQTSSGIWRTLKIPKNMVARARLLSDSTKNDEQFINLQLANWDFTQDSISLWQAIDSVSAPQVKSLGTLDTQEPKPSAKPIQSVPAAPVIDNKLSIQTENPGAHIFLNGLPTLKATPSEFQNLPPGKYEYEIRWEVNENLWAQTDSVNITPKSKVFRRIKSQRVRPELIIQSKPQGSFVFFEPKPDELESHWKTPLSIKDVKPGIRQVTLKSSGYQDTTFYFNVQANNKNIVEVKLNPIAGDNSPSQNYLLRKKWSKVMFWSSIPSFALATVSHALAEKRISEAWKTKKALNQPSFQSSNESHYVELKKTNHKAVRDAQDLYTSSQIFLGIATLLCGVGFTLQF